MASGLDLLRMLEPAVRPIGTPARPVQPTAPIEQRPFDQLLAEAQRTQGDPAADIDNVEPPSASPLAALSGVSHIENGSLRTVLQSAGLLNGSERHSEPVAEPRVGGIIQG